MIALFLVGMCALPLAQLPMKALTEVTKSSHRMQMHRLADFAFSQIKEKLYQQEISWKEITNPRGKKAIVLDDGKIVEVGFKPLGKRKFIRKCTLHSVGKKGKSGEESRLVTFEVKFTPQDKKYPLFGKDKAGKAKAGPVFIYKIFVTKSNSPELIQPSVEGNSAIPSLLK
ncbi:MAG: hypothetical protein WA347_00670 [Rhabdochlamydiaceae bacterium]